MVERERRGGGCQPRKRGVKQRSSAIACVDDGVDAAQHPVRELAHLTAKIIEADVALSRPLNADDRRLVVNSIDSHLKSCERAIDRIRLLLASGYRDTYHDPP